MKKKFVKPDMRVMETILRGELLDGYSEGGSDARTYTPNNVNNETSNTNPWNDNQ